MPGDRAVPGMASADTQPLVLKLLARLVPAREVVPVEVMLKVEAVAAQMSAEQLIEQEDILVRSLLLFDPARGRQIPDGRGITEKPQRALRVAQIGAGVELPSTD